MNSFANVKPSLVSWLTIGVSAVTFIIVMKVVTARWQLPGFTQVIQAV